MKKSVPQGVATVLLCSALSSPLFSEEQAGLDWWAFQPVVRPAVPAGPDGDRLQPIDAFVRARLHAEQMVPAPAADRRTLIKRLFFDLAGLPPTAAEIQAFEDDPSPQAYSDLVDRLLASPRFGERWARHWLDVVRFAETNGYERDAIKPHIWKYRDWVIRVLNEDMPYDQFVRAQVAGDELPARTEDSVIATGMLRAGTWNDEPNDPHEYKYERLEDMVDVVSTAFLGLTVKCARCHDHKFDPIPQRDYYRIAAAFWPGAIEPRNGALMGGPSEEELGVKEVFGWTDVRSGPPPLHLLKNGEADKKGEVVEPGLLSLVPVLDRPMEAAERAGKQTGRRSYLAEFIVDRRNPLTARVMVNRIWQQLMGGGIVATSNNFGFKAAPPTHPALLDWLAAEFVDGGWKIKSLIREIVHSETYRQSSGHPMHAVYAGKDAGNELLWKMSRRRKDAEALRDSMLAASGELNLKMGGPSFYPVMAPEVLEGFSRKSSAWTPSPEEERHRRSVYMISKRHLLLPLMTAFDFPNSEKPCGRREVSTVAPQVLAMLNNHFVHERSEALAERVHRRGAGVRDAILHAWKSVLGREPTAGELVATQAHYDAQRAHLRSIKDPSAQSQPTRIPVDGLALRLSAGKGTALDENGGLKRWKNLAGDGFVAAQADEGRRPRFQQAAIHGRPGIRFSGKREFLQITGQVVTSQDCTIIALASDASGSSSHRELFSNWNGKAGNSGTSLFLGLTGGGTVRFSDNFASAREMPNPRDPFVLAASTGMEGTVVMLNGVVIDSRQSRLAPRNLSAPYVVGQQGNIDGEYWHGTVGEVLVYNRQLKKKELAGVSRLLMKRYEIAELPPGDQPAARTPEFLALASVCHVLMNTNEFLYVD